MNQLIWKLWKTIYRFLYKRFPTFAMSYGLSQCVKHGHLSGALVERPPFMFGILVDQKQALTFVILDTPPDMLTAEDMQVLDAWWSEEAKSLVHPIVDKINLLTGGNK
jgi:hypothetical protein